MAKIEEKFDCIEVTMDEFEKASLFELAKGRCLPKIKRGTKQNFHAPQGRLQSDYIGIMGEYAAACYFRCLFDDSIHMGGDGGIDLRVGNKTIQVKTTFYKDGRIIYMPHARMVADYTVLAVCEHDKGVVKLVGWISRENILKCRRKIDLGHGLRYVIDKVNLDSLQELYISHVYENPTNQLRYQKVE